MVVYATEPEVQSNLLGRLGGASCTVTVMNVTFPDREAGDGGLLDRGAMLEPNGPVIYGAPSSPSVLASAHATEAPEYPLVVSSNAKRPIKSRRPLYESLLSFERRGVVIVERFMHRMDLVLSPAAALVIMTCDAQQPVSCIISVFARNFCIKT